MSHFTVLVAGDDHDYQLAPYHEFECTGHDDEFVKDVDITDKVRADYEADTNRFYVTAEGERHSVYSHPFWRDATEDEKTQIDGASIGTRLDFKYQTTSHRGEKTYKVEDIPEGVQEVTLPATETMSFIDYIQGEYSYETVTQAEVDAGEASIYGYILVDDAGEILKVIDRTNEQAKWDWYRVGGRWSGFLLLKDGTRADSALKSEIDFAAMQKETDDEARETYRKTGYSPSMTWRTWEDVLADASLGDHDAKREFYWGQKDLAAMKAGLSGLDFFFFKFDNLLGLTEDEYVAKYSRGCSPYAMVVDRQWYQKGEMGWWGMSSNEVTQTTWNEKVRELIADLPDDTRLTLVDCHI